RATTNAGRIWTLIFAGALLAAAEASAIEAGINIDVHQDIVGPHPNGFLLTGRVESGAPLGEPGGGGWSQPPALVDHVNGPFTNFAYAIVPDPADPGENWYLVTLQWDLPPETPGLPYCMPVHLGVLFDLTCHNVVIDVTGTWLLNGTPIGIGMNQGFVPVPGFLVNDRPEQWLHLQNGNGNGVPEPGEIESRIVQMDVLSVPNRTELENLLGPEPFQELNEGGLQAALPWVRVFKDGAPISESNPWYFNVDSFFDVFLDVPMPPVYPEWPVPIEPGGFLLAREKLEFMNNNGLIEQRWVWEYHEAHQADLGDAPDSTNTWGMQMFTYPTSVFAYFPTVYRTGSPPYGPIHWQPLAAAYLGPMVTLEDEADLLPDQDGVTNIDPIFNAADQDGADDGVPNIPLALPHCVPTTFDFIVTTVNPVNPMYVNAWFDWNRDGDWDDIMDCPQYGPADEWAVQNMVLAGLTPNTVMIFTTPPFMPWHPGDLSEPIWMRITLSEQPWQPGPLPIRSGGDGPDIGYALGETEDYYFSPTEPMLDGCCLTDGTCADLDPQQCLAHGGTPQGQLCTGFAEACCLPDMTCLMVDPVCCDDMGGTWIPTGELCTQPEACCMPDGTCVVADPVCCREAQGTPQGAGTACTAPLACCLPDGSCVDVDPRCCDDLGGIPGYTPSCLGDLNANGTDDACEQLVEPQSKWSQPPHGPEEGFDAPSDLWIHGPAVNKVEQLPDAQWPGLHAHDYEFLIGIVTQTTLADDWICDGGEVTALEWWGNYETDLVQGELRGSGIAYFHLSIHGSVASLPWALPFDPELWGVDVPFMTLTETDTGMINSENARIYHYAYALPAPFVQELGVQYWFDIEAHSNVPSDPALWRWQESRRDIAPPLEQAPAVERTYDIGTPPGPWQWIEWPPIPPSDEPRYSDMAFRVVSAQPPLSEVNKVVADDFISDGRPIEAVRWWGSYLDPRYLPDSGGDPLHTVDGWLISFHHADPVQEPQCPPDALAGDLPPTVLGVYFADRDTVGIIPTGYSDCLGHPVYEYRVDLSKCCLVCYEADPRDGGIPATTLAFNEVHGFGYWLDIQAVTGARWFPLAIEECMLEYTGHLPSDENPDGHFWGWHTSPIAKLLDACTGEIVPPFTPPYPLCWNYGAWVKQPWLCPPPEQPVNMAFDLLTTAIRGDCTHDGIVGLADHLVLGACMTGPNQGPMAPGCECIDLDVDSDVDLRDFALFTQIFTGP
ncbi:MAG TPA: GEVED domain-containing protein, partial [Phycisphaerae bacterium]|nr:GEVED domain-containing protein [Phycisphaerae bacterium]